MTSSINNASQASKGQYARPQLAVYGSVRNLTGGSSGANNDGSGPMTTDML